MVATGVHKGLEGGGEVVCQREGLASCDCLNDLAMGEACGQQDVMHSEQPGGAGIYLNGMYLVHRALVISSCNKDVSESPSHAREEPRQRGGGTQVKDSNPTQASLVTNLCPAPCSHANIIIPRIQVLDVHTPTSIHATEASPIRLYMITLYREFRTV